MLISVQRTAAPLADSYLSGVTELLLLQVSGGGARWALNAALNVVQINQHVNETLWGQIKAETFCPSSRSTPAHIWEFGWGEDGMAF